MSEQDAASTSLSVRPTTSDHSAWRAYWQQSGQAWRTEPEIDEDRQKYLTERRVIIPDIEKGKLSPLPDALVFSFMSFHGRGFFPSLNDATSDVYRNCGINVNSRVTVEKYARTFENIHANCRTMPAHCLFPTSPLETRVI
jgi:hypothetical protein